MMRSKPLLTPKRQAINSFQVLRLWSQVQMRHM
jgi:hypothetical protein